MNTAKKYIKTLNSYITSAEEFFIFFTLATMTLITVANVVARYVFNSNILWALEVTVFLFAWLIIVGASHGIHNKLHLGIDIIIANISSRKKKILALASVFISILYALLLLMGSWEYWYGFVTDKAFLETEDVPMPEFLQFFSAWFNDGEIYEKMPRFIPYFALPLGLFLLTVRLVQAAFFVCINRWDSIITSHE